MSDQSLRRFHLVDTFKRYQSRWLHTLAGIVACVAISGSGAAGAGTNIWTTNGPYGGQLRAVAIDPVSSATVYVAGIGGVFKSINGGTTWAPASTGITRYDQHIIVNAVVVSPGNRNTLFAAENTGLYKSNDGGASWSSAGVGFIGAKAQTIAFDPTDANKIYVSANDRIFRSADGGNTWVLAFSGLNGTTPYSIAVAPGAVFAGTSNGLFKSVDGGATWAASSKGFPVIGNGNSNPILTLTVAVDPKTPSTLYATPRGQLHKSVDGGANWTALNAPGGYYFALDPQTPTTLFVSGEGVSRSTDGGVTWTTSNAGLSLPGYPKLTSGGPLAVDPRLNGTVFFGTFGGIFRSTNGGSTWAATNTGLANVTVHVIAVDPLTPTTIYAGTRDQGIFKSTDGGASWADSSNGLYDPSGFSGAWVTSLAIDPVTPSTIYAGTNNFVFKSIDSGASWKPARTGIGTSTYLTPSLAINPLNPKIVVAGTLGTSVYGGIFLSTDGAATWTQIRAGLPDSATIYGLSFGTKAPQSLWAFVQPGSFGTGIYMNSLDSGATWSPNYAGLNPSTGFRSVANFLHTTAGVNSIAIGYDAAFQPLSAATIQKGSGACNPHTAFLAVIFPSPVLFLLPKLYLSDNCGVSEGLDNGAQQSAMSAGLSGATAKALVFTDVNSGLPNAGVKALAVTPSGDTLYSGLDGGSVYRIKIDNKRSVMTEFYNPALDYYFMSSRASDIALLDNSAAWRRTEKYFNVNIAQEPGTLGINRYYFDQVAVNKSRGSHFYTLVQSEKDALTSVNPGNTQTPRLPYNEGVDSYAFAPLIEGVGGSCAAGQTPVYRLFRGPTRFPDNANHRFTTDPVLYNSFVALGWDGEGVKFCAPN